MEYKEKLVQNLPAIAQNATMPMAKKVKENILHVMTVPVLAPHLTAPQNLAVNPPHALLKVPNTFVIK